MYNNGFNKCYFTYHQPRPNLNLSNLIHHFRFKKKKMNLVNYSSVDNNFPSDFLTHKHFFAYYIFLSKVKRKKKENSHTNK